MINPALLIGLNQATYLMDSLVRGRSKQEIIDSWGGDEQLVTMWTLFLEHNHWIERGLNGWSVTAKGNKWSIKGTDSPQVDTGFGNSESDEP